MTAPPPAGAVIPKPPAPIEFPAGKACPHCAALYRNWDSHRTTCGSVPAPPAVPLTATAARAAAAARRAKYVTDKAAWDAIPADGTIVPPIVPLAATREQLLAENADFVTKTRELEASVAALTKANSALKRQAEADAADDQAAGGEGVAGDLGENSVGAKPGGGAAADVIKVAALVRAAAAVTGYAVRSEDAPTDLAQWSSLFSKASPVFLRAHASKPSLKSEPLPSAGVLPSAPLWSAALAVAGYVIESEQPAVAASSDTVIFRKEEGTKTKYRRVGVYIDGQSAADLPGLDWSESPPAAKGNPVATIGPRISGGYIFTITTSASIEHVLSAFYGRVSNMAVLNEASAVSSWLSRLSLREYPLTLDAVKRVLSTGVITDVAVFLETSFAAYPLVSSVIDAVRNIIREFTRYYSAEFCPLVEHLGELVDPEAGLIRQWAKEAAQEMTHCNTTGSATYSAVLIEHHAALYVHRAVNTVITYYQSVLIPKLEADFRKISLHTCVDRVTGEKYIRVGGALPARVTPPAWELCLLKRREFSPPAAPPVHSRPSVAVALGAAPSVSRPAAVRLPVSAGPPSPALIDLARVSAPAEWLTYRNTNHITAIEACPSIMDARYNGAGVCTRYLLSGRSSNGCKRSGSSHWLHVSLSGELEVKTV